MERGHRPWEPWLSEADKSVIRLGAYGTDTSPGRRPCLLLVDLQEQIVGANLPILNQLEEFPSGVGEQAWAAIERLKGFIETTRHIGVPVIYTMLEAPTGSWDGVGLYGERIAREGPSSDNNRIVPMIAPAGDDLVIKKLHASSFFGTHLVSFLIDRRIDTLLLAGGSTSGCVRATAVDAASLGFKVIVLAECTFDRIPLSHAASLLDIWMKYGAVMSIAEATNYLRSLSKEDAHAPGSHRSDER